MQVPAGSTHCKFPGLAARSSPARYGAEHPPVLAEGNWQLLGGETPRIVFEMKRWSDAFRIEDLLPHLRGEGLEVGNIKLSGSSRLFMRDKPLLPVHAPGITAQAASCGDDPVTGD